MFSMRAPTRTARSIDMGASSSLLWRAAFPARHAASKPSQKTTNGNSLLGTLLMPLLPVFLESNPMPNGFPWSLLDVDTNYYRTCPRTGVIRSYDFTVSRGLVAPDGHEKHALLVNGAFPGPLIEANWGDTIQVTVRNNISGPEEGVALHWHGFLQTGKPWQDGVPAVTQCPIAPGRQFTYSFEAELYGTSWYHSHYSAQFAGGLFGPMVVYGPREREYDVDVGPVMLSDWHHGAYADLVHEAMRPHGKASPSDNNLINGKNDAGCALGDDGTAPCRGDAGVSRFRFRRGKTHRLRLVNAGSEALQRFSIDGHSMTVIANDFVTVEPYETDVVTLGVGQRTDVLVRGHLAPRWDAYWMRANISVPCSLTKQPHAVAVIYYDGADETKPPRSTAWHRPDPGTCANDDLRRTRPRMRLPLPEADLAYVMEARLYRNATGSMLWSLDGVSFRGNYNSPTLLMSHLGNLSFDAQWNVKKTDDAKSVRVHVKNTSPVSHPMHLHGFNMYVLSEGLGEWNGSVVHAENPQRRDVVQLRANGYLVVQFDAADNPGVWPLHCHVAWHLSAGFMAQFVTGTTALATMRPPSVVAETCRQWGAWTETNIPHQIDSGL
ncbi:ascorbase and Cu-oxidase [Drechmeria coniospora]|uniref:Ascorbase and Cu-oxidase n=1 Tax=Drechmeria coniospora TaxID=98403 RepID=A0A151GPL2_DRECN|nr:ascorbase and Cu-oxidase [Drechmeria coniospora]KYK59001.1 ascorbase and Cu-oxidase [Drechmeria coniospora]ODA76502.1 hypothetical protein RJ55_07772 [Drechmeria coniospora]